MNDRIKLAEAMGWTNIRSKYIAMEEKSYPFGVVPGNVNDKRFKEQIPDPFTDANDCNALITHLNRLGYDVTIICWYEKKQGVRLVHPHGNNLQWQGDNWMHGVCELALKVME